MTERELQAAVVEAAALFGWMAYHTYDSRRSQKGFPDLVLARRGEVLFVELKSEKGHVRPEQRLWHAALEPPHHTMHDVYIWRPSDWTSGLIVEVLR